MNCYGFFVMVLLKFANGIIFNGSLNQNEFPTNFKFGVATSAYQIEGGWNANGKGVNIWDYMTHTFPDKVYDSSNGDIACDSYHKFREDVQMAKSLGVQFYRLSLSWSRILPTGLANYINEDGVRYYNDLIDEIIANGMEPMVTLFHFDLPQPLQELGGLPNPLLVQYFVDFARVAFHTLGDKVKIWITVNEPMQMCRFGYGGGEFLAPSFNLSGLADYLCTYTLTRAHVKIYHLYDKEFRSTQNGIIGHTFHSYWFEPASDSLEDKLAAERMFEFYTGLFANPIFGDGDWPKVAKERIDAASKLQNLGESRLPKFTPEEIKENQGTADFLGLNYYFAAIVKHDISGDPFVIDWDRDAGISYQNEGALQYPVGPAGLRKILKKLSNTYINVPIYITENGLGTSPGLKDYDRANYFLTYLSACLDAIYEDKVNLVGYAAWSLMDNFEWLKGYTIRFGIYSVDFEDPALPRTRKLSADVYAEIAKTRKLPEKTLEVPEGDADPGRSSVSMANIMLVIGFLSGVFLLYVKV